MKTALTRHELEALLKKSHESKAQLLVATLAQTNEDSDRISLINKTAAEMQILNQVYFDIMTEFKQGEGNE
jgi:hypothetical protein